MGGNGDTDVDIPALETKVHALCSEIGISESAQQACRTHLGDIKAFDASVYAHSLRVGIYACELAKQEGRPTGTVRLSMLIGLLHDRGKAAFDKDLFSGRAITPEEYEALKEHPAISTAMLSEELMLTAIGSGMHHQRPNGDGYGLDIEDLPFETSHHVKMMLEYAATLVGMCDWMDALFTRGGIRMSGTAFDREDREQVAQALSTEYYGRPTHPLVHDRVAWLYRYRIGAPSQDF